MRSFVVDYMKSYSSEWGIVDVFTDLVWRRGRIDARTDVLTSTVQQWTHVVEQEFHNLTLSMLLTRGGA